MTYGDARYQSKRISISALKTSSIAVESNQQGSSSTSDNTGGAVPLSAVEAIPVMSRSASSNPYAAVGKPQTFMAPIPDSDPMPPAPDFSDEPTEPAPRESSAHFIGATRIYELAEKYVSVFQAHAASQMTPEQRQALIVEVATFYSAPFRAGRLEALVSAFDC